MNTILNMMSALYNFVIEPFLLPNNFNTKILNQLIFTIHGQLWEKIINNHYTNSYLFCIQNYIYIFGVIPAANTARVLIPYRNITNICHKLIIYRH